MKKCICHDNNTRIHDEVIIYEDPLTELKPEGKATLLHKVRDECDGLELWKVCFIDDELYAGEVYERLIKAK
jgi:hypothetical protein